jgi:2-polyprenyl-3-methyl-5-hydroxy-6-metoxy-1,4-benzoquinol methylase
LTASPALPSSADELRSSDLLRQWWYYSVELLPGVVARGIYPDSLPMLPRILLRHCDVTSASCLDIGTMEGLIPTLLVRRGARRVLAIDAVDHCVDKLRAVQHYHGVSFGYQSVGLMYDLAGKLPDEGFDVVNCSGLLYHVFSPLHVLAGLRPLLKRNGVLVIATGVVADESFTMEFNNRGRLQAETNTFWYVSIPLLEYQLRYLKLAPIDCLYLPHSAIGSDIRYVFDKPSGYLTVVCRAMDDVLPAADDEWMLRSVAESREYGGLVDWERAARQPSSEVAYRLSVGVDDLYRSDTGTLDIQRAVGSLPPVTTSRDLADSHFLGLEHRS